MLQKTTIGMLPEDILLEIFDFYRLDAMKESRQLPWKWHRLAHVSRKWRHVISVSPRRLDLRILCEYGAPIEGILGSWSTLPLFVQYNNPRSTSKSKSLPNNIIVALHHPGRVYGIDLVLPSSLAGPIAKAIQEPLQALECIRITVENATGPPMIVREAFLGGSTPHLREIKLDGIAIPFPQIRQVLLSTNNLVELHLASIPNDVYFSPNDLATGLSALVRLNRLMVGFLSPASRPPPSMTRVPSQRTIIPSLTSLNFHGAGEYLEELVARIDLPALCEINILFFNDIIFEVPRFCQIIPRLNVLRGSPTWVTVKHSMESVAVRFFEQGKTSENCFLETSCGRLDWQLSFATQILNQLPPLSDVCLLNIHKDGELPTVEDGDTTQWLEFFQPFTHVTQVHVWENRLVPGIVRALVTEDTVLPSLALLHLSEYRDSPSLRKAAEQFVVTRGLSGHTVQLME